MDFQAIGEKVFSLHMKYAASLMTHFDMVVVHTTQTVAGDTTVTNVTADGVPPILRSVRANSSDLGRDAQFFASGSLEGVDPQLVYSEILKIEEYREKVYMVGKTVFLA